MHRRHVASLIAGAFVLAREAGAQPKKIPRVAWLALLPGEDRAWMKAFRERLAELGYREGENLILDYRSAEGRPERLPDLAAELVQGRPDVLVAGLGTLAAKAAAAATKDIPVVFNGVGDPVGAGLVASLAQPGGNVTGNSAQATDFTAKQVQLIEEVVPAGRPLGVLLNPDTPNSALSLRHIRSAAAQSGRALVVLEARTRDEVAAALERGVEEGAGGLVVVDDPLTVSLRPLILERVAAARLPAIYGIRDAVDAGGLMAYGIDSRQLYRRTADYVDRLLKGARPADLPVEQPTRFFLVVNRRAARSIGLTLPASLLDAADETID
ncbi:MAG: ABC transporter substrate-binding protein [Reyranellaceae bacterium]